MRIVVAMDSFKGSLTAEKACEAVARGLSAVRSDLEVVLKPMADGGEGTARAVIAARNGLWLPLNVMGPLPEMRVDAGYAWFESERTALVEMAVASGLTLLDSSMRNPMRTTTYGTGELIKAAAERSPEKILLAVGGSATVDGGVGAAMALGWKFNDKGGESIALGGGALGRIQEIVPPSTLELSPVEVLCDVKNKLCGPQGAARVYGPQKGATPEMMERLEWGLEHLAEVVRDQLGVDIDVHGAGAAGGLSAGAVAFMNAKLVSGIETIMECTGLAEEVATAEWVVTGEGCFDHQSLQGKVVSGVVETATRANVSVAILAGSVNLNEEEYASLRVKDAIGVRKGGMSLEYAIQNGERLLCEAAAEFARKHLARS